MILFDFNTRTFLADFFPPKILLIVTPSGMNKYWLLYDAIMTLKHGDSEV